MSGAMVASLVLKLNDQGSGPAARALQTVTQALKETGTVAKSASDAAISAFRKMVDAREVLGIRSEKAIQNEIRQTEAAYQRLAQSGQASARELGRAQDAMRQKVGELRRELEGVNSSAGRAGGALTRAMSVVGGLAAAKAIVAGPIRQTMGYSRELAHVSNTLYATSSVAERIAAKTTINGAVMNAVRTGGGSREQAMEGLKTLGASGAFGDDPQAAFAMLPAVVKAAMASGADVNQMANIAIKAKQNMGLTDYTRVFGMAAQGGIAGQFELRDMAKWLPQQMAYSARTGIRGEYGFATLVAMNQIATRTAGTQDEAGNNVRNLLGKINSTDTASDAKKLGIDLAGSLAAAQAKGVGGVDAFLNLTEQVAAKDRRLIALRKRAKAATGDDLRGNLAAQADILEGSAIGKLVQDQQAMSALVALLNGRGDFNDIRGKVLGEKGTIDSLHQVVAAEPAYNAEMLAAERANSLQRSLDRVNPLLGGMADGLINITRDWPAFAASIEGATLGLTALAGAAGTIALGLALFGGKGAGAAAISAAAGATGGMLAGAGVGAIMARGALGATAAYAGGYAVGTIANEGINWGVSKYAGGENTSLGGLVYDLLNAPTPAPIVIENRMTLDGQVVSESVNKFNARQAARN